MNLENLNCMEIDLEEAELINGGTSIFGSLANYASSAAIISATGLSMLYHSLNPHHGK